MGAPLVAAHERRATPELSRLDAIHGWMDVRASAAEEQGDPLVERRLLGCRLWVEDGWQAYLGPGRDDQEPISRMAQVREAAGLRADERVAAQIVELLPQGFVAGLDVAYLLTQ